MSAEPTGGAVADSLPAAPARARTGARGRRLPVFALSIIGAFVLAALLANVLSPADPEEQSLRQRFTPPVWDERGTWQHVLGTDRLGRDLLSRIIWGSRVSLTAGVLTVLLASAFGAGVGLVAGYHGGSVDAALMRITDATMSFPVILPALILLRHLFPNTLNTLTVLVTLQVGYVIIVEASLSFLGAGIPPPTPAWGSMIAEGRDFVTSAWWVSFFPGLAILLVVLAFNLLGDWLRDTLDPKLRQL